MITCKTIENRINVLPLLPGIHRWGFTSELGIANGTVTIEDSRFTFELTERMEGDEPAVVCAGEGTLGADDRGPIVEFDADAQDKFDFFCEAVKGMSRLN